MSNYVQTTFFAPKDLLLSGNPAKLIKGADVDPELAAIATAIATKYDSSNIGSAQIAFASGTVGAPGIAFVSDLSTGVYRPGASQVAVATGGSQAALFSAGGITTPSVAVTGSTVPGNGMYQPSGNAVGFATNSIARGSISSAGLWTLNAPTSGAALNVNGAASNAIGTFANANANGFANLVFQNDTSKQLSIGVGGSTGGGLSQNQPQVSTLTSDSLLFGTNNVGRLLIAASNTNAAQLVDDGGTFQVLGWRDAPQNAQAANYTFVLADRGKSVYPTASGLTFTIPANATTAFPAGTTIVVPNETGGNITIAITTDTLTWAGTTTTGARTVANKGLVTLYKASTTSWFISGVGIS